MNEKICECEKKRIELNQEVCEYCGLDLNSKEEKKVISKTLYPSQSMIFRRKMKARRLAAIFGMLVFTVCLLIFSIPYIINVRLIG